MTSTVLSLRVCEDEFTTTVYYPSILPVFKDAKEAEAQDKRRQESEDIAFSSFSDPSLADLDKIRDYRFDIPPSLSVVEGVQLGCFYYCGKRTLLTNEEWDKWLLTHVASEPDKTEVITRLRIEFSAPSDQGLANLFLKGNWSNLRILTLLDCSRANHRTLEALVSNCPRLESLALSCDGFHKAHQTHLGEGKEQKDYSATSDGPCSWNACLPHLVKLAPKLGSLYLTGARMSSGDATTLLRALPHIQRLWIPNILEVEEGPLTPIPSSFEASSSSTVTGSSNHISTSLSSLASSSSRLCDEMDVEDRREYERTMTNIRKRRLPTPLERVMANWLQVDDPWLLPTLSSSSSKGSPLRRCGANVTTLLNFDRLTVPIVFWLSQHCPRLTHLEASADTSLTRQIRGSLDMNMDMDTDFTAAFTSLFRQCRYIKRVELSHVPLVSPKWLELIRAMLTRRLASSPLSMYLSKCSFFERDQWIAFRKLDFARIDGTGFLFVQQQQGIGGGRCETTSHVVVEERIHRESDDDYLSQRLLGLFNTDTSRYGSSTTACSLFSVCPTTTTTGLVTSLVDDKKRGSSTISSLSSLSSSSSSVTSSEITVTSDIANGDSGSSVCIDDADAKLPCHTPHRKRGRKRKPIVATSSVPATMIERRQTRSTTWKLAIAKLLSPPPSPSSASQP